MFLYSSLEQIMGLGQTYLLYFGDFSHFIQKNRQKENQPKRLIEKKQINWQ